ncbi:hypothetical protein NA57DRAFT_74867 [Rhizodiscina lignyota]|uniref:Uncharacterized protein n=1 Tax=Rhizodiscina lignyota TaxID=1504668 RepID=A0A9P4ICJ2_9PEZI|nr:hypothetical protein NA57DRAFT_74867 [Rhizodiscina lignyota]
MANIRAQWEYQEQLVNSTTTPSSYESGDVAPRPCLTFGVELEFVFLFHEDLLLGYLREHFKTSAIVKDVSWEEELMLRQKLHRSIPYNSWALTDAGDNPTTVKPSFCSSTEKQLTSISGKRTTVPASIRAYHTEPLHILHGLLSSALQQRFDVFHSDDWSKKDRYEAWTITDDISLSGTDKRTMTNAIAPISNVSRPLDLDEWDSYGVELVSPPYRSVSPFLQDLKKIVTTLQGHRHSFRHAANSFTFATADILKKRSIDNFRRDQPLHTSTADLQCGFHVHVGLPDGTAFDTRTLQTLAYLVIVYAHEISTIHHSSRRGRSDLIVSNRENFYAEPTGPILRTDGDGKKRWYQPGLKSLEEIRTCLFDRVDRARDPVAALIQYVGNKMHIVNFAASAANGARPRTVEFRQHTGTLDVRAVEGWVRFCVKLVELAQRYARGGQLGKVKSWDDDISLEDLMGEMELEPEWKEYFKRRQDQGKVVEVEGEMLIWEEVDEEFMDMDDEAYYSG